MTVFPDARVSESPNHSPTTAPSLGVGEPKRTLYVPGTMSRKVNLPPRAVRVEPTSAPSPSALKIETGTSPVNSSVAETVPLTEAYRLTTTSMVIVPFDCTAKVWADLRSLVCPKYWMMYSPATSTSTRSPYSRGRMSDME